MLGCSLLQSISQLPDRDSNRIITVSKGLDDWVARPNPPLSSIFQQTHPDFEKAVQRLCQRSINAMAPAWKKGQLSGGNVTPVAGDRGVSRGRILRRTIEKTKGAEVTPRRPRMLLALAPDPQECHDIKP